MLNYRDKKLRNYHARLNRALDFICKNIDRELSLEKISSAAGFSPFHFHRIFSAMVGETINSYVRRIRLEKAAMMLVHNPFRSITEIALDCGFSSSSNFARVFKEHFGMSASQWRENGRYAHRLSKISQPVGKNEQAESKAGEDLALDAFYNSSVDHKVSAVNLQTSKEANMKVVLKKMPAMHIAYVRHMKGYWDPGVKDAWEKISRWAGARGFIGQNTKFIGISHDDPDVTPADKCRYDACVSVPEDTKAEGEVSITTLPAGNYAVYRFDGKPEEIKGAYDFLYGKWMPESGYQPADSACYEIYHDESKEDPEHRLVFDICLPVKPM